MGTSQGSRLDGKIAAITGAAGGIGGAIAQRFAAEGARVCLMDRAQADPAGAASALEGAIGVAVDIAEEASVSTAFESLRVQLGDADILVNAAAIAGAGTVEEMPIDEWDAMFRVNTRGTFLTCRAALPAMRKNGWGRIINLASEVAFRGNAGLSHYAASKAAVVAFTKCLAHECVADGVRANVLAPGPTDTAMLSGIDADVIEKLVNDLMPIKRLGRPEEIAAAALYLASDEADFCVGMTLNVNGGAFMM